MHTFQHVLKCLTCCGSKRMERTCTLGFGTLLRSTIFAVFCDALFVRPGEAAVINTVTHPESRFISGDKQLNYSLRLAIHQARRTARVCVYVCVCSTCSKTANKTALIGCHAGAAASRFVTLQHHVFCFFFHTRRATTTLLTVQSKRLALRHTSAQQATFQLAFSQFYAKQAWHYNATDPNNWIKRSSEANRRSV